jgi:hypothetical protein
MPSFLAFSSLGISAGLYIYGVESGIIPEEFHFAIILILMAAGIVISYSGVRAGKAPSEQETAKAASEALKLLGVEKK